jgi:hypothetical protein
MFHVYMFHHGAQVSGPHTILIHIYCNEIQTAWVFTCGIPCPDIGVFGIPNKPISTSDTKRKIYTLHSNL